MCAGFIRKGEGGGVQMSGAEGGSAGERRNNGMLTKRSKLASEQPLKQNAATARPLVFVQSHERLRASVVV